jgi:hypothetical protein
MAIKDQLMDQLMDPHHLVLEVGNQVDYTATNQTQLMVLQLMDSEEGHLMVESLVLVGVKELH